MVAESCLTAAQIYEQITNGPGPGTLSDADQAIFELAKRLTDRAGDVAALRQQTMEGWQGAAGNAAADLTAPLVQASVDDVEHLSSAKAGTSAQLDAFHTAKNSVKQVPAQPPEMTAQDVVNVITGNKNQPSYQDKVAGYQADSQHNIDVFGSYHSASTANGERMPPQYATLADPGADVSMDDGSGTQSPPPPGKPKGGTGGYGPGSPPPGRAGGPGQTGGPGQPGGAGHVGGPGQPGQFVTPAAHNPGDGTHTSSYVPQPVPPPPGNGGYQFGPTGQATNPLNTPGGSGGGFGPYGGGGFGPGSGEPGGGAPGSGARPLGPGAGSGRGGVPNENMAGRGGGPGAGAAGARGQNGMGGMGAGKGGKKEEDKEKKAAAYLKDADPDETYGLTGLKPMPPVIGERRPRNQG